MKLELLKNASIKAKQIDGYKQDILESVTQILGVNKANKICESFDVQSDDYDKWLEVIRGYSQDQGINISKKTQFQDVAFAVLDNDPKMLDDSIKEAIVDTLWARQKVDKSHSRVERAARAREEEEQLKYALRKMSGREDEEQFLSGAGQEYEEDDFDTDFDEDPDQYDRRFSDEDDFDEFDDGDEFDEGDFDEFDDGDEPNFRSRYRNDEDEFEEEEDDWDIDIDHYQDEDEFDEREFGDQEEDWEDFEDPRDREQQSRYQRPSRDRFPVQEQEEVESPFTKGQDVVCRRDGQTYKVEIPDGPSDMVGIMDGGRIRMVPSKDLEARPSSEESEEYTSKPTGKLSFLHDVLTGEKSQEHMKQLQQKIENDGANAWTSHHAKLPKNPHPRGSFAYKAWEKGVKNAAKEIWAPKPVVDPTKVKAKPKPKKK